MPNFFNPYRLMKEDPKLCGFAIKHIVAVTQVYSIIMLIISIAICSVISVRCMCCGITVFIALSFFAYSFEERISMIVLFWINVVGTLVFGTFITFESVKMLSPNPMKIVWEDTRVHLKEITWDRDEIALYLTVAVAAFIMQVFYTWMCLQLVKAVDRKNLNKKYGIVQAKH